MFVVGLTGGVGAGKSVACADFARRGAFVIDADELARLVLGPGTSVLAEVAARFGSGVVDANGELDRAALARIVFSDPLSLHELDTMVHPEVRHRAEALVKDHADTDHVVVLCVPLWVESGHYRADVLIDVDAPEDQVVARLVRNRGWTQAQAKARIERQASRQERIDAADYVIDNSGSSREFADAIEQAWQWLEMRRSAL